VGNNSISFKLIPGCLLESVLLFGLGFCFTRTSWINIPFKGWWSVSYWKY